MKALFRMHAVERMFERGIEIKDVQTALTSGEEIEHYRDDAAYPGRLLLWKAGKRTLHVVVADDLEAERVIVVTCYRPDRRRWTDDFRRRRDEVPDV